MKKSPWPFISSFSSSFLLFFFLSVFFGSKNLMFFFSSSVFLFLVLYSWFFEMIKESFLGSHKSFMKSMFKFGMIMFIVSEMCFFFSFFWSFFYKSMNPYLFESSFYWPPFLSVDSWGVPFLKTLMLLSSGVCLTWGHHILMKLKTFSEYCIVVFSFVLTLILGVSFEILQFEEYCNKFFFINSSVYGSSFYLLTGFHGFHVFLGLMMLFVCFIRLFFLKYKSFVHQNLLLGAWYWHFVDVVWLFLFIFVYVSYQNMN